MKADARFRMLDTGFPILVTSIRFEFIFYNL